MSGYIEGLRNDHKIKEERYSSRAWIEPEKKALIIRQDLQNRMEKAGSTIKIKNISRIQFSPVKIDELVDKIKENNNENNKHSNFGKINLPENGARLAALSIVNIVQKTFESSKDIEFICDPEMFEYMSSLIYDNPQRSLCKGAGVYNSLSEVNKNNCRKLIVTALEVFANPIPPAPHR